MAPIRAFSFPLSQVEEVLRTSPFTVDDVDALKLDSSEAFQTTRSLLVNEQGSERVFIYTTTEARADQR